MVCWRFWRSWKSHNTNCCEIRSRPEKITYFQSDFAIPILISRTQKQSKLSVACLNSGDALTAHILQLSTYVGSLFALSHTISPNFPFLHVFIISSQWYQTPATLKPIHEEAQCGNKQSILGSFEEKKTGLFCGSVNKNEWVWRKTSRCIFFK